MRDYDHLRIRTLELLREGWKGPRELVRELMIPEEDAKALLAELEERREVWRDGPLAIAREGRL